MDQRGKNRTGKKWKIPVEARDFSLLQNVQTGSGVHPASHSMGTRILSWE
jgi:hypothetical protein